MRPALPLVAVAALLLSGCFAPAPGRIAAGDEVQVRVTGQALDGTTLAPETTVTITNDTTQPGPLVARLRQELAGHSLGQTFSFTVAGSEYPGRQAVARRLAPLALERAYSAESFSDDERQVGHVLQETPFKVHVVAVTNATVTLRSEIANGLREPLPQYGLDLVYEVNGNFATPVLEPKPGATFRITPDDHNFEPGAYRVLGIQGDKAVFEHNPFPDQTVRYTVKILGGGSGVATDGNYIARTTPALANATADDGHDHVH
ncbi:MAG: hypothetical protein QOD77_1955 [Thermoplasmata archaeon]|jgi:FKBP-type peptidyl-prolyl cis-trans isomerase 2|nr:hypothetical protein [Thermoplasmata archaeon]